MPFYFFFMIIIFVLDSGSTDNKEEVKSRLPVIYPSYLYLTVPPKKDVMFNCKVKSATNLNISWSFNNKSLQSTTNRRVRVNLNEGEKDFKISQLFLQNVSLQVC